MTHTVLAQNLRPGDVLALPFGRRATVAIVDVGRRFVNLKYCEEEIPNGRIKRNQEVLLETELCAICNGTDHVVTDHARPRIEDEDIEDVTNDKEM